MKRELIYPFFAECVKYSLDKFWKNIFEDLAYGVTPYGTYINKDLLTCNFKDKEFVYKIQKKDPKDLHDEILHIFKTKLGLFSREEIIKKKNDLDRQDNCFDDWCSIKKKNLKEVMIERFVIENKKRFNLTLKQSKYLVSVIFLAFTFKVFVSSDVVINQGKIEKITGLEFSEGEINLKKNIYDMQVNVAPEIILEKKIMSDEWERFLLALKKE
jgi:hypothetical protein